MGRKAEQRLHALGVRTIGQLAALPERVLIDHFGAAGRHISQLARGQDDREVVPDRRRGRAATRFATELDPVQARRRQYPFCWHPNQVGRDGGCAQKFALHLLVEHRVRRHLGGPIYLPFRSPHEPRRIPCASPRERPSVTR